MEKAKTGSDFAGDQRLVLTSISAGIVIGILVIFAAISFAALIFAGELVAFLSQGIGIFLFGAFLMGVVVALSSSIPSAIALPQDLPAVITAVIAAAIASLMTTAAPGQIFATVVAAMMLSGILTGLFFWLLGRFNLGQLVRFIPYPVIGGFLAGTGWLLIVGAVGVMMNAPLDLAIFAPQALGRWLPGLLFGLLIYLILRRYSHFLVLPVLILTGTALFYVILFITGGSLAEAAQSGSLLGPFPEGSLWQPLTVLVIGEADWRVVASQAVTISTIMLVSAISLLMNASGLEITTKKDYDLNRELRSAGLGDILAGIAGCFPGYHSVGFSALGYKLGASSRVVGLTSAVMVAAALFGGAGLLALFPRVVVGGFLIFVGISFLFEWLYDSYFKLSKVDYALIWLILIVIAAVGFLEGVAVGIVVAAVLFVFNYSRVKVARHAFTGAEYQSHVLRPPAYQQILFENGQMLTIIELQGYIFFGTAYSFLEQIRQRIDDADLPAIRFLLLDFRLVTGIDSSATLSMQRLMQTLDSHGIQLILTHLSPEIQGHWKREILNDQEHDHWQLFPEMNQGVAWCEYVIIDEMTRDTEKIAPKTLTQQLHELLNSSAVDDGRRPVSEEETAERLGKYTKRLEVAQHDCLLREGEEVEGLFFVEKGQVIAKIISEEGREIELRSMETGSVFGEIGVYSHLMATADVTASQSSILLKLPAGQLQQMEDEDPQLALAFHRLIAGILAEKLAQTTRTVRALQS